MPELRYAINKLRTDYYLSGVQDRFRTGRPVPPPGYVIWDCTRRCNLTCAHCGAIKEKYSEELTTDQVMGFLDQLARMKVRMFAVTGGEPLLRRDLEPVLDRAHRLGLRTGIATNGFLLDQSVAGWLADARVHSVQVSLDGLESTHNHIRGNELSYSRAVQAIDLLKRANIPVVSVATTVTRDNLHEIESLGQLLPRLGVRLWRLAVVMPIGRSQGADTCPDGSQLAWLLDYVRTHDSHELHIYLGENLTFLGGWERQVRTSPAICPIGFSACCIGVDGYVRGCPEQADTADNREGSLLESSFQDIWQNGFSRYRNRTLLQNDAECAICRSKNDCLGGCWVMRTGDRHCFYEMVSRSDRISPDE